MKRATAITLLLVIGLVLLPLGIVLAASEAFTIVQITANTASDGCPKISGDRIVWSGAGGSDRGTDREIFTWTPTSGTVQLTENGVDDRSPGVAGDRVVWSSKGGTDGGTDDEIFTWTPTTGMVQLTTNDYEDFSPEVSGDRVVWCARKPGGEGDILTWTPQGGTLWITQDQQRFDSLPSVSGERVVWEGEAGSGGRDLEIYTWTLGGGTFRITRNNALDTYPRVSGDRVVWLGDAKDNPSGAPPEGQIFTWTPAGGVSQLTHGPRFAYEYPRVSGDRVVWTLSWLNAKADAGLFTWTATEGVMQIIAGDWYLMPAGAEVSGDRIVWAGAPGVGQKEIFAWTPAEGIVQVTNNDTEDTCPDVSGDRIAWQGTGGSDKGVDAEIFTAAPSPQGPSFPDVPASHPYHAAIVGMAARAIIGGYEDGRFGPDDLVMRQQFAKMIVGTFGIPVVEEDWQDSAKPFVDLGPDDPAKLYPHEYVAVCARNNITKGTKDPTKFAPYDNITRAQVITMVVRAADSLRAGALAPLPDGWTGVLPAGDRTHGANIARAERDGLLAGIRGPGGTLAGWDVYGKATRGEVAQILWNLLGLMD